ncbi:class E basic helix-loop-helix protein 40 isoform X1 [Ranitomeya variabilis]|uniref:class E basic helix-loop-helix protein 40 isoform X1 n=1 Tax=Ranitomeya variabilis TaxID=490064 RepID=UPI004056D2FB
MERIPSAQPPPACLERSGSLSGMDFAHMYPVFKSRKAVKRCEEGKQETYKLPHRLIEKKRRDRINECISQLKDLLPEHLKLTTLGHLEKAVVLELTLKHVQSLSNLIEQQQQQILTLQKGGSSLSSKASGEEMFRSGFQVCAEEALRFLQGGEKCELVAHLHRVASDLSHSPSKVSKLDEKPSPKPQATNCVPVIRRAAPLQSGEQSGTDTDTDSGYGGEVDKVQSSQERRGVIREDSAMSPILDRVIKQEHQEIPKKRLRLEIADDDFRFGSSDLPPVGSYSTHPPFCFPFYLIPPTPSAYLPMLEKCWYPGSMPMLYPSLSQSGLLSQDCVPQVHSPELASMDSSALLQALKQVPTVGADPKD